MSLNVVISFLIFFRRCYYGRAISCYVSPCFGLKLFHNFQVIVNVTMFMARDIVRGRYKDIRIVRFPNCHELGNLTNIRNTDCLKIDKFPAKLCLKYSIGTKINLPNGFKKSVFAEQYFREIKRFQVGNYQCLKSQCFGKVVAFQMPPIKGNKVSFSKVYITV